MKEEKFEASCVPCDGVESRDWYAWINLMLPQPNEFHFVGEVYVSNPGVEPFLTSKEPQGINPEILLLDLYLFQKPGVWPQVLVWKPVRYDKVAPGTIYTQVQVFCRDKIIADKKVEEIQ